MITERTQRVWELGIRYLLVSLISIVFAIYGWCTLDTMWMPLASGGVILWCSLVWRARAIEYARTVHFMRRLRLPWNYAANRCLRQRLALAMHGTERRRYVYRVAAVDAFRDSSLSAEEWVAHELEFWGVHPVSGIDWLVAQVRPGVPFVW